MRVSRLRLHRFRGWAELDLRPAGHVLLAGVPRSGRSDIVAALSRLLDPASIRIQPSPTDLHKGPATGDTVADVSYAEVEVTLVGLDEELEQLCDGYLEPLDNEGQVDLTGDVHPDAALGVRMAYRLTHDPVADTLDTNVYFPVVSDPATGTFRRVPSAVRRALPVVVLGQNRPLQLRPEGLLRRLVTDRDAERATAAFLELESAVAAATHTLSGDPAIAGTVEAVLQVGGIARHLAEAQPTSEQIRFQPEDGSLSALLRAVQPALELDGAGPLALTSHGSTATAVLAAAEALLVAASFEGAVILGDDVGEGLDAATAEHLAAVVRAQADQVWLTTRREEVARAFDPNELIRLTRTRGARAVHQLATPKNKKEVAVRRLLHTQLLPALTARTIAVAEGPHDLATYISADRHHDQATLPLAAAGVRLVSADNGSGGGIDQVPRVADLAHALGFRVVALVDGDPEKTSGPALEKVEDACDAVVRLPESVAIERAMTEGVSPEVLRSAAGMLEAYGVEDPTRGVADDELQAPIVRLLHKRGLHEQFLDAVVDEAGALPPLLATSLATVVALADPGYAGPARVDLPAVEGTP